MEPPETVAVDEELILKRWEAGWAEELTAAVRESLPQLKPFLPWAKDDYDLAAAHDYIQRSVDDWADDAAFNYAIFSRTGELVGSIGLMTRMGPGTLEVGYWLRTPRAGRGHMTAAVTALAEVGFTLPGIDRMIVRHDPANGASAAVATKAGFTVAEPTEQDLQAPGGLGTDVIRERLR
jgi:ribosomal-protein-serine acetyltransferase